MTTKDEKEIDRYWRKLMGQSQVALSGASKAELRVQLFETLQDFFDNSNCWLETIKLTVIPNTLDYKIYPLTGRILRLFYVLDQNNTPQPAVMPEIGTLHFIYPYNNTQPMNVVVIKTVTDPLCCFPPGIPDWILPTHGLTVMHGLVGKMMLQPGQSYSNPQMANYHTQKFRDGWAHARVAMIRANTVGTQNWMFPQSYRTRSQKGGVSTYNVLPTPR